MATDTEKMNPEVKRLWIEALRSGEYKQAQAALRKETAGGFAYCCLGVLCDIFHQETGRGRWGKRNRFNEQNSYLPPTVQKWAGLKRTDPIIKPGDDDETASDCNDSGKSFRQIAQLIEKNL